MSWVNYFLAYMGSEYFPIRSKNSWQVHMSMCIIGACLTTCFCRRFLSTSWIRVFSIPLENHWQAWNAFGLITEYRNPMNTNSTIPPNSKEIKKMLILQDFLKIKLRLMPCLRTLSIENCGKTWHKTRFSWANYFSLYWIRVFSNLL